MKSNLQILDGVSIGVSVLCALHCAVLPFVLIVFPAIWVLPVEDHVFHQILVWMIFPASVAAVFLGCRRHKDCYVVIGAVLGLGMLVFAATLGHDFLGETGEKAATFFAAVLLSFTHWRNFSLCRQDACNS